MVLRWQPSMKALALCNLISKQRVTRQLEKNVNSAAFSKPTPGMVNFALSI
jgi:hypothetical protein